MIDKIGEFVFSIQNDSHSGVVSTVFFSTQTSSSNVNAIICINET